MIVDLTPAGVSVIRQSQGSAPGGTRPGLTNLTCYGTGTGIQLPPIQPVGIALTPDRRYRKI